MVSFLLLVYIDILVLHRTFVGVWLLHLSFPNSRDLRFSQKWPWSHIVVDMQ
jgi:hypothetical protein